jgi:uncharacterized protein
MPTELYLIAFVLFFIIASVYSSVGHAGASGYLAVMALLNFPVDQIKSTTLLLNIIVASIASYQYIRAGYFDRRVFLSFIFTSVPFTLLGSLLKVDPWVYKILAGGFLVFIAAVLVFKNYIIHPKTETFKRIPLLFGLIMGGGIGFVAGLIGIGGGIFLSPLIILLGYSSVKNASGIVALFILCNSFTGLVGHVSKIQSIDVSILFWVVAVAIGGFLGSHYGAFKFNNKLIVAFLCLVLLSAGLKLIIFG